jgi:hypothetical protein
VTANLNAKQGKKMKAQQENHQKAKKVAKVRELAADNPHREALINRHLLSTASLNS